jgi:hypothetical protein
MASSDARPGEGGTSPGRAGAARTAAASASKRLASIPTRALLVVLVVTQWILTLVVAIAFGRHGSLAIVVPQVIVLLPLALVLVHATALRLGQRLFAAWAAAVWVVLPYAGLLYATPSLRHDYAHRFLPHLLGLADDPKFPAMVAFLAATFFTLRALETGAMLDVGLAVGSAGLGAAFAPRVALVALAPVVGLAVAGRWRLALTAGAGIAILLAVVGFAVATDLLGTPFAHVGLHGPGGTLAGLSETFWSGRVLEWLAIAGVAGAFRGARAAGAMFALALLAGLASLDVGSSSVASNLLLLQAFFPVWSIVALAVASIPLLVPHQRAARTATQELAAVSSALRLRRLW